MIARLVVTAAGAALFVGLALSSPAVAAIDSYMKPTSETDAVAKCGPKPTQPGDWVCLGKTETVSDPKLTGPKVASQGAPKIEWTWTDGGAPKTDAAGGGATAQGWGH